MSVTPNSIVTPQTPFSRTAVATTAETTFNNPINVVDLLLSSENVNGARLTKLVAIPRAAVGTATNCQLYERDGSTYTLVDSVLMATVTPGAAAANPKTDFGYSDSNPIYVRGGYGLAVAIGQSVTNGVAFKAEGGFY